MQVLPPHITWNLTNWRHALTLVASELHPDEYVNLLTPKRHSTLLTSKRTVMIVNRARFIALLFAILTPLWGVMDYVVFPFELWLPMVILRVLTSAAFIALILLCKLKTTRLKLRQAHQALLALFLVPCVFYLVSLSLLSHHNLNGISPLILTAYTFLPLVLMAGLSIFPLSLAENLLLTSLILLTQLASMLLRLHDQSWTDFFGTFWLLLLLAGTSLMAGTSQLAFIVALVRQAVRDPLTSCFTRRSGEELLSLQFSISTRSKTPLALAFVDLDHFKLVNDKWGHEAGDHVLRQAADIIMQIIRSGDMLLRWGGEEFLIIMPDTNIYQAEAALTRLQLAGLGKRPDGDNITASIGVTERLQDKVTDLHELIKLADQRMYRAKENGRNQIVIDD
ncbi:GGDEF domain-containing protein [Betaproteobacteria bacterium]|nr:GGDEF domain-containing protein [Betaproteobacteria bacterium]GHU40834.1 GGDEF domain-containing protein [Betaproteobacteria bacterium]